MNYPDVRRGGRAPIAAVSAKSKYGAQSGLTDGTVPSLAMDLRIERLASAADIEAISGEWEALSARTSPWSPVATPTWNMLWWKHYCNRQTLRSREFFVHVVRGESDQLIGVAPSFKPNARHTWSWRSPRRSARDRLGGRQDGSTCTNEQMISIQRTYFSGGRCYSS